jgi:hypothetical protein
MQYMRGLVALHRVKVQYFWYFYYAVLHNNRAFLIWRLKYLFRITVYVLSSLVRSFLSFSIHPKPYYHFWTWLHLTAMFLQRLYTKKSLDVDIHCGSALFPYGASGRQPAQETSIDCAELYCIINPNALNIHSACSILALRLATRNLWNQ